MTNTQANSTWGQAMAEGAPVVGGMFYDGWKRDYFGDSWLLFGVVIGLALLAAVLLGLWLWQWMKQRECNNKKGTDKNGAGFKKRRGGYMPDPGIAEAKLLSETADGRLTPAGESHYVNQEDPDALLMEAVSQ